MLSMALGVMLVVAVLTIHGVVSESFRTNSSLGYNMIVGADKGGKLQLTLNTVYYLSQPVENIPYDLYLEFLPAERRQQEYENSLRVAGLEAQQAVLEVLDAQGDVLGLPGGTMLAHAVGQEALVTSQAQAIDYQRDGKYSLFTQYAIPLCLGDYYGKFRCVGTTPAFFDVLVFGPNNERQFTFREGRNFHLWDEKNGYFEAVVGATVAREMKVQLGDSINPAHGDPEGHTHGQGFTVVGILDPTGTPNDRAVFVNMEGFYLMDDHAKPLEEGEEEAEGESAATTDKTPATPAQQRQPLPLEQREVTALLVRTVSPLVTDSLHRTINKGQVGQAVLPIQQIFTLLDMFVAPFQWLLLLLTAMICVVSGVSILVSIYNSMSDRRRDIAVMRALGASRSTVSWVILLESLLLALGGGLIGSAAGHTLNWLASDYIEDMTGVSIGLLSFVPLEGVLIPAIMLLAVVVGFIPAMVAYRTDVSRSLAP